MDKSLLDKTHTAHAQYNLQIPCIVLLARRKRVVLGRLFGRMKSIWPRDSVIF